MKKFLLSTSAIVGVGLIAAPASAAERIKLSLGGFAETYIGFMDAEDDARGAGNRDPASFGILTDKEVHFSGSTKLDNGITISVRIELEAVENATTIDESWVDIASPTLGNLRIGGDDSVNELTEVVGPRGFSDDYNMWIVEANMIAKNDSFDDGNSGDSNKISYFTPRIDGFQLGLTYVPEPGTDGQDSPNYFIDNHAAYAGSLSYQGTLAAIGVNAVVAMYHQGNDSTNAQGHETNYNAGLELSYQEFSIGGAYGRFMDDWEAGTTSDDGYNLQGGIQYARDPYVIGLWHLRATTEGTINNTNEDNMHVTSLFGEYGLSDGVKLEGMIFQVSYDDETGVDANEQSGGWGMVVGMRLDF